MFSKLDISHIAADLNIYVTLYRNVQNAGYLREQLIKGNTDFEFAFIDGKSILSIQHLRAAIFRAVTDMTAGRLKSKNVHSEIVFALSPNNNIAESFRRFGVTDNTKDLLAIKVCGSDPACYQAVLDDSIEGEVCEVTPQNLAPITDEAFIRKVYKMPTNITVASGSSHKSELELMILGEIALKGAV